MKTRSLGLALLASCLLICISLATFAQDKASPEAYSGVAMKTGGGAIAGSTQFDFRITQYTTDEELQQFATLLKEKGNDALRNALEKEDKGRITITGTTGNQISLARKRQQGSETIITIVTARTMAFMEQVNGGRATDYPFGFLQVKLDADGKGSGQIIEAAKISFDKKKGKYDIKSYGNQPIKVVNVRPSK